MAIAAILKQPKQFAALAGKPKRGNKLGGYSHGDALY